METWPDWRYRLVSLIDRLFHAVASEREFGPLCNLERRMWWDRWYDEHIAGADLTEGADHV